VYGLFLFLFFLSGLEEDIITQVQVANIVLARIKSTFYPRKLSISSNPIPIKIPKTASPPSHNYLPLNRRDIRFIRPYDIAPWTIVASEIPVLVGILGAPSRAPGTPNLLAGPPDGLGEMSTTQQVALLVRSNLLGAHPGVERLVGVGREVGNCRDGREPQPVNIFAVGALVGETVSYV